MSTRFQDAFIELQAIVNSARPSDTVRALVSYVDRLAEVYDLEENSGGYCSSHAIYGLDAWRAAVAAGETRESYWFWVADQIDEEGMG